MNELQQKQTNSRMEDQAEGRNSRVMHNNNKRKERNKWTRDGGRNIFLESSDRNKLSSTNQGVNTLTTRKRIYFRGEEEEDGRPRQRARIREREHKHKYESSVSSPSFSLPRAINLMFSTIHVYAQALLQQSIALISVTSISSLLLLLLVSILVIAQTLNPATIMAQVHGSLGAAAQTLDQQQQQTYAPPIGDLFTPEPVTILPAPHMRPNVRVNLRDFVRKVSDDIKTVANRTSCLHNIEKFFEKRAEYQQLDVVKLRDQIINQINILLGQHRDAVSAIVNEAERLAMSHNFVKNLRVNYTDVHRLRNELDPNNTIPLDSALGPSLSAQISIDQAYGTNQGGGQLGQFGGSSQVPQFTSINGGTPVPGPVEWQTPIKSIHMHVNKNFGDIPVNTSMSAVHLPLPIYAGLPEIMNGIAWTERLDYVFKSNLNQYAHVHHQYYGDHLGFLRTFPAHKWRIARTEPDLFDARTRPWYVAGASSPKDVVILVDASGSMTGLRREIAKGVVFEILDTLTNNDYFAVMRFNENLTPVGLPKCQLKTPKLATQLDEQCHKNNWMNLAGDAQKVLECQRFRWQQEQRTAYLRDHPAMNTGAGAGTSGQQQHLAGDMMNANDDMLSQSPAGQSQPHNNRPGNRTFSYLSDDAYQKSIYNVTQDIQDAYLLPATSRNIRYLKSNFSMPTAGIANFTHALMGAFELLAAYNRTGEQSSQCNQAIMLITDGAIKSHEEIFNRYNYPNAPVRVFTYMIGREVGDISHTKAMACNNRGYYTHVINLGEVREQVQKYIPVMARPMILSKHHPTTWTGGYGDETHQVLTDWVLEAKRRERARIMLNEQREREREDYHEFFIELTGIPEYDEVPLVFEEITKPDRQLCEEEEKDMDDRDKLSLEVELDPMGYNELNCHWASRRADLLTSVVKPVFDMRNSSLYFERILHKNIWTEKETHVRNAQLLGVAAVDLRIGDIMRAAPSYLFGPNGYAALVGQRGFVMHHPDLRALLEDPFDKQSKILKPYFSAVDLSHIEQVNYRNESDQDRKRDDDLKLLRMRDSIVRRQANQANLVVKRAVDCRRRAHVRAQSFYYGPIKDTPFSFIIAVPQSYGLNRMEAKLLELTRETAAYFQPSEHDLWTIHPDYKYCASQQHNSSLVAIVELMRQLVGGSGADSKSGGGSSSNSLVEFDSASALYNLIHQHQQHHETGGSSGKHSSKHPTTTTTNKILCDKDLFPSLLFDAAATYEKPDSICGSNFGAGGSGGPGGQCDVQQHRSPFSFYSAPPAPPADELCGAHSAEEMRSKLANIYGLEMSFLATRSGLTRVGLFDLSYRIKKLADLFMKRHSKAVDEAWYARTVDWNMRFNEEATIITVPYNAHIRLLAKLRQRITANHPLGNDTGTNCDPYLPASATATATAAAGGSPDSPPASSSEGTPPAGSSETQGGVSAQNDVVVVDSSSGAIPAPASSMQQENGASPSASALVMSSDDPMPIIDGSRMSSSLPLIADSSSSSDPSATPTPQGDPASSAGASTVVVESAPAVDYNTFSSFDFLDMLSNSSVHVSATQSAITNKGTKQRTPVAVSGLLYDYATFARRFLNSTSLDIKILPEVLDEEGSSTSGAGPPPLKVDICPNGECPTKCGYRNDSIDCLLVDNNAFIVVGEELAHIGRSLAEYDSKLLASLVERRIFHQINLIDYQAICQRNNDAPPTSAAAATSSDSAAKLSAPPGATPTSSASTPSAFHQNPRSLASSVSSNSLALSRALLSNFASTCTYLWAWLVSTLLSSSTWNDLSSSMASSSYLKQQQAQVDSSWSFDQQQHWQRSVVEGGGGGFPSLLVEAQNSGAGGGGGAAGGGGLSSLSSLPNKTYLRPCEKTMTLYETRPARNSDSASSSSSQQTTSAGDSTASGSNNNNNNAKNSDEPEYYVTECGCSGWYVYEWVPKTNLLMLLVNTTYACRKNCASTTTTTVLSSESSAMSSNVIPGPTLASSLDGGVSGYSPAASSEAAAASAFWLSANKTAEEQVCLMLERDSQLYTKRQTADTCYSHHPEETHIHICGAAFGLRPSTGLMALYLLSFGLSLLLQLLPILPTASARTSFLPE